MTRVVVVQPYVPQYRVPFFQRLSDVLAGDGIDLTVAAGNPRGDQAARADSVQLPGLVRLAERRIGVADRSLVVRSVRRVVDGADLVVLEQARRNIEAYPLLLRRSAAQVALWGHGRTTTRDTRSWEHRWLDGITLRADWFLAYTEGGRRHVVERGFPAERTTVVQNSTDTTQLVRDRAAVSARQRRDLMAELGVDEGRTALYVGALDASKRIGFLLATASELSDRLPGFTLVVCGDGPWRSSVEAVARSESWLRYVGPAFGADKARLASVADVVLNPGRVGLAVVDAFALELPMITTDWPGHAPEFEYLLDGVNARVTPDSIDDFVSATHDLLTDPAMMTRLRAGCRESAGRYGIEEMVDRFAGGVRACLASGRAVRATAG